MDADPLSASPVEPWSARPSLRVYSVGAAVILLANAPIALWAKAFFGRGACDARTHAMIAYALSPQLSLFVRPEVAALLTTSRPQLTDTTWVGLVLGAETRLL